MSAPRPPATTRRELVLAAALALLLAALPLGRALASGDAVLLGADAAAAGLPWSRVVPEGSPAPRNPALYDQGVVLYPYYSWLARSVERGDPPTWNPWIHAGVPGLANPQSGVLDPQVWLLVLLHRLGGEDLFHRGFAVLAWLRIAAAGLGAYLLARALGLARAPSALAGAGFGLSGFLVLWLNHPLGHVPPFLPWVLLGVERTRGGRPAVAAAGAGLALLLAVLGGHPETAFAVGAAGGIWALAVLAEERRAGLLALLGLALGTAAASASLLPFVEYLSLSGAMAIREIGRAASGIDVLALGGLAAGIGIAWWSLRVWGGTADAEGSAAESSPRASGAAWTALAALGLAAALGGTVLVLAARGLPPSAPLVLLPDLFGWPGAGKGYAGPGNVLEAASGWIAAPVLVLAFAAALSPAGPGLRPLRRRGLLVALGLVALLLVLRTPGLLGLWRRVPLVGLGDTVRLAPVAALALALLAAEGLQAAPRASRAAAALALALLAGGALLGGPPDPPPHDHREEESELFRLVRRPPEVARGGTLPLEAWVHPSVPVDSAVARVQALDASGRPDVARCFDVDLELLAGPSAAARAEAPGAVAAAPEGATWIRASWLEVQHLDEGPWRVAVDLYSPEDPRIPIATRVAGTTLVRRERAPHPVTLALFGASLVLVAALAPSAGGVGALLLLALALAHGLWTFRGTNPLVPESEVFPPTETEAVLAEVLGPHRFLSEPYVMPPNTGMVRELRSLDGYDAMDVAAFNHFRPLALRPGINALLGFHARGADLASPAFRLYGVGALVLAEPIAAPGFELVAGPPGSGAERAAECHVYRATDPLPRAFCVPEVVALEELARVWKDGPAAWDPLRVACVDGEWRPADPFSRAEVTVPEWTNALVRVEAELDGDGLLVLTDQSFPGWKAYVGGEETELLTANAIFRGVPLGPGRHEVVLRYEPWTVKAGLAISAAAVLALAALGLAGLRAVRRPALEARGDATLPPG